MPDLHDTRMIFLAGSEIFDFSPTIDMREVSIFVQQVNFVAQLAKHRRCLLGFKWIGSDVIILLPWDTKVVLSSLVLHRALLLGRLVFCCEQLK